MNLIKKFTNLFYKEKVIPLDTKFKYTITKDGRVFRDNKELKGYKHNSKFETGKYYNRVNLAMKDGTYKKFYNHRLVLLTYHRKPKLEELGCHKDDNSLNNHINNLYWGDYKTNGKDRIKNK